VTTELTFVDAGLSDVGKVRKANEDSWLARADLGIWAVADGMGGHTRGDVASGMIVAELARIGPPADARTLRRDVDDALARVDAELKTAVASSGEICATTVVALLVFGRHFAVLWAGDSRAYRLRDGRLERLTRDHSLVQELIDSGALTPEAAASHPLRSRLTRGIGTEASPEVEGRQGEVAVGDRFLLCSDGLTGHLGDEEIARVVAEAAPGQACRELIERTLRAGASDNVTAVMVLVEDGSADRTHPGTG
jgi:protein phosphatase